MVNRLSLIGKNFRLNHVDKIRIVAGTAVISWGWMEYLSPSSTSSKWVWIKRWAIQQFGEKGFVFLLVFIGLMFIAWALLRALSSSKGDRK